MAPANPPIRSTRRRIDVLSRPGHKQNMVRCRLSIVPEAIPRPQTRRRRAVRWCGSDDTLERKGSLPQPCAERSTIQASNDLSAALPVDRVSESTEAWLALGGVSAYSEFD